MISLNSNAKKLFEKFMSLVIIFVMIFTFSPFMSERADAAEGSTRLTYTKEQGSILHAWDWSFRTIEENIDEIKDAGYDAIQVSPVQGNKDVSGEMQDTEQWWILYQPINFKIGNKQLGTRDEFKSMCSAAKSAGLKVYVDIIGNHTGNKDDDATKYPDELDDSIKNIKGAFHDNLKQVDDWDDRYQVTHGCVGLPDLNTENKEIQKMFRKFLQDCLDCGADGFRLDTAKHIGLPTDEEKCKSDFYPNVFSDLKTKDGDEPFIYGEVLQGGADNFKEYSKYINLTSSNYGANVRSAVGFNSSPDVTKIEDYSADGVDTSKLITWVESHDNYANDDEDSTAMNDEQIKNAWALIGSRKDANPLFFNRPKGRGKLDGSIGDMGNDLWRDADVIAVNKFRQKMIGKDEKLVPLDDKKIMIVERGEGKNSGAVIVNLDKDFDLDSQDINLEDGVYKNSAANDSEFTVTDGKITGKVCKGITVLYEGSAKETEIKVPVVSIDPDNKSFNDSLTLTLRCKDTKKATYSLNGSAKKEYKDGDKITIGDSMSPSDTATVVVEGVNEAGNRFAKETYQYIKKDKNSVATIYFKKADKFQTAYIYAYNKIKESNQSWPGEKMTYIGNETYKYELKNFTDCNVIINDWFYGNNKTKDLKIGPSDKKIYDENDKSWKNVSEEIPEDPNAVEDGVKEGTSKVYFQKPDAWKDFDDVDIYFYGKGDGPKWPGIPMKKVKGIDGLYEYTLPKGHEGSNVLFNANSGKVQVPGHGESGYKTSENTTMIYDGTWHEYTKGISKAYFRKPADYKNAYIYVWKDSGEKIKDWPGTLMDKVEGTDTLYSYTLPQNYGDAKVIFTDGEGKQTEDLSLPFESCKIYDKGEFRDFTTDDLDEPQDETKDSVTKVYFKNSEKLKNIHAYVWNTDGSKVKDWPGVKAKDEGNGLFSYSLPKGFESANIIFNWDGGQTKDLTTKIGHSMICDKDSKSLKDLTKVYFKNVKNWKGVSAYYWNDGSAGPKDWPGVKMTSYGNGLYGFEMPEGYENANVIFNNNGKGQQTDQFKSSEGKTMILDKDNNFREFTAEDLNAGSKHDDDNPPKDDDEKEKFTQAYFYNADKWKDNRIYCYTEDSNGNMKKQFSAWPGEKLKSEGKNLYSYVLPKGFANSVVIFNGLDSSKKIKKEDIKSTTADAAEVKESKAEEKRQQTPNLKIKSGQIMIYDKDHNWRKFTDADKPSDEKKKALLIRNVYLDEARKPYKELKAIVTVENGNANDLNYKWFKCRSKDGDFYCLQNQTESTYSVKSSDSKCYIKVEVIDPKTGNSMYSDSIYIEKSNKVHHGNSPLPKNTVEQKKEEVTKKEQKEIDKKEETDKNQNKDGWKLNLENNWVYLENNIPVKGWKLISDKWYFMNEKGVRQTGWHYDNLYQSWFYFYDNGEMAKGWILDKDGSYYYLYDNGEMAHDTMIGIYYVNSSGKWIA